MKGLAEPAAKVSLGISGHRFQRFPATTTPPSWVTVAGALNCLAPCNESMT
jgi:hypothetical protein